MAEQLERAAEAIRSGLLVIYPTETVYGLGGDALDPMAIERVFIAKGRSRERPLSVGFPNVDVALDHLEPSATERAFMERFLPGPVTVLIPHGGSVPAELTGGRERVGVRIPDHALARRLLAATGPITATSANRSGRPSASTFDAVDGSIRAAAAVAIDGGETPGGESTVVNVASGTIVRRGRNAAAIEQWIGEWKG